MLCEKCSQREATTHIQQTINGKTTVRHLCSGCADEAGLDNLFGGFHFGIGDLFGGLLGTPATQPLPAVERVVCPRCHSDLKTIIDTGKIGCADCYTAFRNQLMPTVERLHGKSQHCGKLPRSAGETVRKQAKLRQLQKKLNQAIEAQEFEDAARYRDEIKQLDEGRM